MIALPLALSLLTADYRPESQAWNGLASLAEAATRAGCPIEARDELDWARLDGHDVLWWVYPRSPIDPEKLVRYVAAGGRAVIADDFGASDGALRRLELERHTEAPQALRYFQSNPHLPEAHAARATALSNATPAIATNHPAFFQTHWAATFEFSPGQAAVVEGQLGRGRFVALSDPSVLINNMQSLDADRRFAQALVAETCRSHEDHILLLTGELHEHGDVPAVLVGAPPPAPLVNERPRERWNRTLERWNEQLLGDHAPADGALLGALAAALAAAALLLLWRAFPTLGPPPNGDWIRIQPPGDTDHDARAPRAAAQLRDEVLARTSEALGEPASLLAPTELFARLRDAFGAEAERAARTLWDERAKRDLQTLHREAVALFRAIERPRAERP